MTTHTDTYTAVTVATIDPAIQGTEEFEAVIDSAQESLVESSAELKGNFAADLNESLKPLLVNMTGYNKDFDLTVEFKSHIRVANGEIQHMRSPMTVSINYADALPADHDMFAFAKEMVARMHLTEALRVALEKMNSN